MNTGHANATTMALMLSLSWIPTMVMPKFLHLYSVTDGYRPCSCQNYGIDAQSQINSVHAHAKIVVLMLSHRWIPAMLMPKQCNWCSVKGEYQPCSYQSYGIDAQSQMNSVHAHAKIVALMLSLSWIPTMVMPKFLHWCSVTDEYGPCSCQNYGIDGQWQMGTDYAHAKTMALMLSHR